MNLDETIELKIVEEDEEAIEWLAKGKKDDITISANLFKEGNRLILKNVHLDGGGSGYSSLTELRQIAREFCKIKQRKWLFLGFVGQRVLMSANNRYRLELKFLEVWKMAKIILYDWKPGFNKAGLNKLLRAKANYSWL